MSAAIKVPEGLALLRMPFAENHISKLPKPTKRQTEAVQADFKTGIRCQLCGQWHHKDVVHLDYVGHAALTDRLLDCDPAWNWEPMVIAADGTPMFDRNGGMWIRLTVCGMTRLGYGDADGKTGGNAIKEVIGDALRNAAMRFGAALDLWHKGDLHGDDEPSPAPMDAVAVACASLSNAASLDQLGAIWTDLPRGIKTKAAVIAAKDSAKQAFGKSSQIDTTSDNSAYDYDPRSYDESST